MVSDEISASPPLSSSRTIAETIFSSRSGSTGRLRKEICSERTSLSRSNGTRRLLRLMTVSSRSCTRSKVVKRKLQVTQTRRRRITEESSVGRESFTCVARLLQLGQRIRRLLLVDREAVGERLHLLLHGRLDQWRAAVRCLGDRVQHLGDEVADLLEFGDAEAAGGRRGGAEPQARGDERLLGVGRDAVLVGGDGGADQRLLGNIALQALRPKVDQHQMVIGAAGDDVEALRPQ